MSRVACQEAKRVMQGIKDGASKCTSTTDPTMKYGPTSTSRQARKFSDAIESTGFVAGAKTDKLEQAEESLRTVMYLNCWGPN